MQRNNRKNMSYSFDIKFKAVKMYLEEGIGSTTIAKELNLSSNKSDNGRKRMYLSAIEDLYNREIIAYKISDNLDMSFVENTLGEAFKKASTGEFRNLIYIVIKVFIINQISISLYLRNLVLDKVCLEKEIVMIMHALKIFSDI